MSDLDNLIARAVALYEAMSPDEREELHRQQRASWVRGEMAMGRDADEARWRGQTFSKASAPAPDHVQQEPSAEAMDITRAWMRDSGRGEPYERRLALMMDIFAARRVGEADNPQWDGTDAAHPAWWRGNDRGCRFVTQLLTDALDGKDDGGGWMGYPPLEALRRRLLAIADHREVLPP